MNPLPEWLLQAASLVGTALLGVAVFLAGTVVFDVVHALLHAFLHARSPLLRALGGLHRHHHDFLGPSLRIRDEKTRDNLLYHRLPEFVTQGAVVLLLRPLFGAGPVLVAFGIVTVLFVWVTLHRGRDVNHRERLDVVGRPGDLLVGTDYHALHHVHPDRYLGSFISLFDRVFGTGCQIAGRRIVMTGANGTFGAPLREMLEREGARVRGLVFGVDWTYGDYGRLDDALREADVLVLAHGSKKDRAMDANCHSFVAIGERFRELHEGAQVPVEIWAVGSEIELHPAWGNPALRDYLESKRAFMRHARAWFRDRTFIYRHIVPSAFSSRMGPGLISGRTAARIALFFIRRGFRYVPVTYTGIALLNRWNYRSR